VPALWYSCAVDIERTIQFILESQAKAEIRMDRWEARMERSDARIERSDARVAALEKRLDRRMDAITKLLQQGMRILVKNQSEIAELRKAQRRTDTKLAELAEAQKETQRTLRAFIASLRNGRNGR
jgi:chromosome segregation ATPase